MSRKAKITEENLRESAALKKLWDARAALAGALTQEQFGEQYDLGSQANISHYLAGRSALNVEAAAKFSQYLGCEVSAFSERLATELYTLAAAGLGRAIGADAVVRSTQSQTQQQTIGAPWKSGDRQVSSDQRPRGLQLVHMSTGQNVPTVVIPFLGYDIPAISKYSPQGLEVAGIGVSQEWLTLKFGVSTAECIRIISAAKLTDLSRYSHDDILLIDARETTIDKTGVYLYEFSGQLLAARFSVDGDGVFVTKEKPARERSISKDALSEYKVLGRVLFVWEGRAP